MAAKLLLSLVGIFVSGGVTGVFVTTRLTAHPAARINTHLFLAPKSSGGEIRIVPQIHASDDAVLAVHDEKLQQIAHENQVSIDDRKLLHDELAREQDREVGHFNTLNDRLNVDEAKTYTALWVIGGLFGALQGISTILSILDFRGKRKPL